MGRSDLLEINSAITFWKAQGLDFSKVFYRPDAGPDRRAQTTAAAARPRRGARLPDPPDGGRRHRDAPAGDAWTCPSATCTAPWARSSPADIARRYGGEGLPDDTITLRFQGSAGQSFGAFCSKGMTFVLEGEANDYVGKGLSGGEDRGETAAGLGLRPGRRTSSSATSRSTELRRARSTSAARPASVSPSATAAPTPSSRASATTAAST